MRDPDTCVTRDRSPQSFFSISATWSSGSNSNFGRLADGADDGVEALVRPDRRAFVGDAGKPQHQRLELILLRAKLALQHRGAGAGLLGLAAKLGLLFGRSLGELGADRVALGPQLLDFGLPRPNLAVERQQLVEVEVDTLVADRALDRRAVRPDEVQSQHGRVPSPD